MSEFNVTELIPLLASERTDVRLQCLQIAAQIVDSTNVGDLCEESVFASILSALDVTDLRSHAVTLIINILAEEGEIQQTKQIMEKMIDFLTSKDCPHSSINLYLILLTNLTISEEMCEYVITYCAKSGSCQILMDYFLAYNPQTVEGDEILDDYSEADVWQYFSSVLCNLCRVESGRRLLLAVTTGNMAGCLKQVSASVCVFVSADSYLAVHIHHYLQCILRIYAWLNVEVYIYDYHLNINNDICLAHPL